jgi:hypothetical protein
MVWSNSSWHWGSYGSIWTCPSPKKYYSKRVLGVHQKSTNFAVLSELGRFPIHYQIIKQMLGYWHRLENLESSFPLLKAAYNSSKKLFLLKKPSWYGSIHYI